MPKLLYQGHSSVRITTDEGRYIYIDPFAGEGYDKVASLVLITHEHYDHNAIDRVPVNDRTIIIRSRDAYAGLIYRDFDECGVHVHAVAAYNSHHKKEECVGYVIDVDGVRIYHAGDTDNIPEMKDLTALKIDYALLPIDGHFTMTPEEASQAAITINPVHMIPIHMKPGLLWDYHQCMKVTAPMAMLVKPGEEIMLVHGGK